MCLYVHWLVNLWVCYGAAEEVSWPSLPNRVGETVNKEVSQNKILHVVLVSPQVLLFMLVNFNFAKL